MPSSDTPQMRVGIIGQGPYAEARHAALQVHSAVQFADTLAGEVCAVPAMAGPGVVAPGPLGGFLHGLDAAVLALSSADLMAAAESTLKQGVHAFLEWPPARSVGDAQVLVRLAEEAGVEVGVSRPLRRLPVVAQAAARPPALVALTLHAVPPGDGPPAWPRWLADALDLCCALAGSTSIQRIDAEAARLDRPWPEAVGIGLRFHTGTYAQIHLRLADTPGGSVYGAGPDGRFEADIPLTPPPDLLTEETAAFFDALADNIPLSTLPRLASLLDALHVLRLVEQLMARLR